jgi:hypothetical protein
MKKKIPVRVQLDADLLIWVQREAEKRHCSMSQVIRDLIVSAQSKNEQ